MSGGGGPKEVMGHTKNSEERSLHQGQEGGSERRFKGASSCSRKGGLDEP